MSVPAYSPRKLNKLVKRAQGGDGEAFGSLVRSCTSTLYRVCLGCLNGNEAEATEAVQVALISAWKSIGSLQNPRYFKTWLVRICINVCADSIRNRRGDAVLDTDVTLADPADEPSRALEADEGFRELVQAAGPANAPAIALYYGEGYRTEEIAELLGISPSSVRQRLSRGRKAIARVLGTEDSGQPATTPITGKTSPGDGHPIRPRAPQRIDFSSLPIRRTTL